MKRSAICVLSSLYLCVLPAPVSAQAPDVMALTNPFHGVDKGGNVVPGAQVPYGFVTLSPQTTRADTSGYDSKSPIIGFAHTFVSGTGGDSKYGNFRVTPLAGPLSPNGLRFEKSNEIASPGYYSVVLGKAGIKAELTATRLAGMHRYKFPHVANGSLILDVTAAIPLGGAGQTATAAEINIIDGQTLSGWASFKGGWQNAPYKLYFYAVFDRPTLEIGTWTADLGGFALKLLICTEN